MRGDRGERREEEARERGRKGGRDGGRGRREVLTGTSLVGYTSLAVLPAHLSHGQLVEAGVLAHIQSPRVHSKQGVPATPITVAGKLYLGHFVAEVSCKEAPS